MPHPRKTPAEHRYQFVQSVLSKADTMTALCARFGYSRRVGYGWVRRFEQEGLPGLEDRSSRPRGAGTSALCQRWEQEILALRRRWGWGPKKLRHRLRQEHPRSRLPSERSIARLLQRAGRSRGRAGRSQPGPVVEAARLHVPRRCNEVWTIDFKGHFYTGDGRRCDPLTVRDLHSRFLLLIRHVPAQSEAAVRVAMQACFARYGLPRVLRVDNGAPFGNRGPRGLSQLSVWWLSLGIEVEFIRPARPQENGAHEQMHRVLKECTAWPPAATLAGQCRRLERFRREYNEERPHEALQMRAPAQCYHPSRRAYREPAAQRCYPGHWQKARVMVGGRIFWRERVRVIGRAFQKQVIGLKPVPGGPKSSGEVVEVYLGGLLLGQLHANDAGGIRAVRWRSREAASHQRDQT
jgi:transposase InsO family protein